LRVCKIANGIGPKRLSARNAYWSLMLCLQK
jgi:hypothetical protein